VYHDQAPWYNNDDDDDEGQSNSNSNSSNNDDNEVREDEGGRKIGEEEIRHNSNMDFIGLFGLFVVAEKRNILHFLEMISDSKKRFPFPFPPSPPWCSHSLALPPRSHQLIRHEAGQTCQASFFVHALCQRCSRQVAA
jgi:hypothetical protein